MPETVRQSIENAISELRQSKADADNLAASHEAPTQNPASNTINAFRSFAGGGLQGLANQQGWNTPDWSKKLGAVLSSPEANDALNFGILKLKKVMDLPDQFGAIGAAHRLVDEDGKAVGHATSYYDPTKKELYLNDITSLKPTPYAVGSIPEKANERAWSLGFGDMRSVIKAYQELYPDAEYLTGVRVSGSRYGPSGTQSSKSRINLKPQKPDPE